MTERGHGAEGGPELPGVTGYEPPRVEQVLTPADLEREMLYGGPAISQDADPV